MPRVKVKIERGNGLTQTVVVDTDATRGAQLGSTLFDTSGAVATPAAVRSWLGLGSGGADVRSGYGILISGTNPKTINVNRAANFDWQGQHNWEKPLWAPDGTAALPGVAFGPDHEDGLYRIGANNIGLSTDGALRWDVDTQRTYQTVPLVAHTGDGRAAFFTNNGDAIYDAGLEVRTAYHVDGSDVELNFWERASGNNRFRWFMYGEPTAQAYFSLYRHDNSVLGSEILRFTRDTQGGDWLETLRIADGSLAAPSLSFTAAPGIGFYYGGVGNEGIFAAATRFRIVQNSAANNARLQIQNLNGSGLSSVGLVNASNNTIWLMRLDNSGGGALTHTIGADLTFITNSQDRWVMENSTGYFRALDNIELRLGTGGDLRLFHNGTNSTIRNDTGNLSINSGATEVLRFIQGANSRVHALNGTAALPTFGWFGDPDNGLYYITTNSFGISTAGTLRYQFGAAGQLGIGGANYGTANTQSIVSGGASAAPSWQTVVVDGQTQTISGAKTWSGNNRFTGEPRTGLGTYTGMSLGTASASLPEFWFSDSAGAADQKLFQMRFIDGDFVFRAVNDAVSAVSNIFQATMTGYAVTALNYGNSTDNPPHTFYGDLLLPTATTATGASAGADTLPANPVGFLVVSIGGTSRKIPYYAT